ncbi:DNA adenine methylase [Amylibacter sp.]|nr:DNA adenine methylase [Amylibacter sp.]
MSLQRELQCFKWTGSKWLIASDINSLIPSDCENYIEPFLGGGSVLLSNTKKFKRITGADLYQPLINLWKMLRDEPEYIIEQYEILWNKLQQEVMDLDIDRDKGKNYPKLFYKCREEFNKTKDPLLLMFLSKTCLNGVIRFSKSGKFNNSFHHGRLGQQPKTFSKCVANASRAIKNVYFESADALEIVQNVNKNDFIFLDPPYFASKNRYIENYTLENLETILEYLNRRGAKWICTYDSRHDVKLNPELHRRHLMSSSYQSRIRRTSGQGVQNTSESIYLNY